MNRTPDVELVLRDYFADDGLTAPDYVLDVVEERISPRRQWRPWPFRGRITMTSQFKLIATLAAVIVIAVVGYSLLPRQPSVGGPGRTPTASPSQTAVPTSSPAATGIQDVADSGRALQPGQWRFHPVVDSPSLSVVADVPAGWLSLDGQLGVENAIATNSAPSGIAIVFAMPAHGAFSDPCHWDLAGTGAWEQDGDVSVGTDVAGLVGALRANTSYTSATPSPLAFGPYSGQQLELRFPADVDPVSCDNAPGEVEGRYRVMPDGIYAQGKANIWRMSIVDVAGTRIVAIIEYFPGTAPDKLAEAQAIVDSFEFTP